MTSKLILIAATALIAAPATAKGTDTPKAGRTAASEQKYCIAYENVTGSRVSRQECRTKKEWAEEGVDVDKLLKR